MSDSNTTAVVDTTQAQASAADANGANGTGSGQGEPLLNKQEAVEYFKRTQKLEKSLGDLSQKLDSFLTKVAGSTTTTQAPVDAVAGLAELKSQLAFRDALADAGVKLTTDQRMKIERLYAAEAPADARAWLKDTAAAFWPTQTTTTQVTAQAQPATQAAPVTNSGAPSGSNTELPFDPTLIPKDVLRQMDPRDFKKRWEAYVKSPHAKR